MKEQDFNISATAAEDTVEAAATAGFDDVDVDNDVDNDDVVIGDEVVVIRAVITFEAEAGAQLAPVPTLTS